MQLNFNPFIFPRLSVFSLPLKPACSFGFYLLDKVKVLFGFGIPEIKITKPSSVMRMNLNVVALAIPERRDKISLFGMAISSRRSEISFLMLGFVMSIDA
jgi:hypothetical protein